MITKYNSTRFVSLDSALLTMIVTFCVFWDKWWQMLSLLGLTAVVEEQSKLFA